MEQVFPSYYRRFSCKAGACRHSCCRGWEIDIDDRTLARYERESGDLGDRLRAHISRDGTPHFILTPGDSCPFLRTDGLCELILSCGEDILCEICREHPRFHNELPDRIESGLGLSCEAAAELILGEPDCVTLEGFDGAPSDDPIIALRDACIKVLQDRTRELDTRVSDMLALVGAEMPERDLGAWSDLLLSLECLDPTWTTLITELKRDGGMVGSPILTAYTKAREREHEQLLVYLVYRYMASAFDEAEAREIAEFAAFSYELVRSLGALLLRKRGKFDFEDLADLVRLFSSEIEYCEENVEAIRDFLRM
ncbi:MAG: flagellin lysine-N-methylase [Clostridia bacterium]|nr:flagellin lysine-N-methylase [Clostridia bacterium]